jgi:hypothetical protein
MNVLKTWKRRKVKVSKLSSLVFCLIHFCLVIAGITGGACVEALGAPAQSPNPPIAASAEWHPASSSQVISVMGGVQ